ncbi:hypothetical protein CI1B_46410 [Bradyrhizobium ivorense]|uniref:Uncharacterized protein n=1 Tax=Bradyrhizobium ivorense TaxID=2511166 RepID=A0A508TC04_9BRAD|nr:hypothetical protein [Bradyrhizobium ivorense]VIO72992.1 hypothetical protein CI1B_46410 [Bradyrhizobium ivorense]
MDASIISAFAALTGATIGGLTSGIANWLNHRRQVRAQWLLYEKSRRQVLYRDFIEEASRCHIDALQHHDVSEGTPGLVALYAKLNRMRVLSSRPVVHSAEHIAKTIMDTYLEPDRSFGELRDMAKCGSIDLLREFSEACRVEFDEMRDRQL